MLKSVNKKVIISLVVVLVLAGGFFYWQEDRIENFLESKKREKMVAPSKDYTIIEEADGEFILNTKDGFKVKIPAEWKIEPGDNMEILESDREVTLYSKDFSYRPPKGCLINVQINRVQRMPVEEYNGATVMYPFEGAEEIKEEINFYKNATPEERDELKERWAKPEIILVDQKEALLETILLETTILSGDVGKYVTVKVPTQKRLFIFSNTQLSEKCVQEFDKFLETVSIDPD